MAKTSELTRKAHFLGTKIRAIRKRNNLTLEELSARCVRIDPEAAPSVSYLSMIENGRRVPSARVVEIVAGIFQKETSWFYDELLHEEAIDPQPAAPTRAAMPLEPGFLFSPPLLQSALPELLAQAGVTGRQFAHLLIRAHQESKHNRFPDLERAAERVGEKRFPMRLDDLFAIAKRHGLVVRWFDRPPARERGGDDASPRVLVRSHFEAPRRIYLNRALEANEARLKYDLANQIGYEVLHGGDGARTPQVTGGRPAERRLETGSPTMDAQDVLYAWRDFECSYFAAALLDPRAPFRQHLERNAYAIDVGESLGLTTALVMRRMSMVSPYVHWHYFDAYPPGNLRAVYRGNGIPLPWGNMTMISDPCPHWAVFRMLGTRSKRPSAQISVLAVGESKGLYCCETVRGRDAAGNPHVLCAGVDLVPALEAQGVAAADVIERIARRCEEGGGSGPIPVVARRALESVAEILNIGWIADGARADATIICPRSSTCPREKPCFGRPAAPPPQAVDVIHETLVEGVSGRLRGSV